MDKYYVVTLISYLSNFMSNEKIIYLDYAATTPTDQRVVGAMLPFFTEKFGNAASRTHYYGQESSDAV